MHPLLILAAGLAVVLGLITLLRVHAFVALVTAAMTVSILAPGPPASKIVRVAEALGDTAGNIAIVIAMAAVVGQCMMASGAADRIVRAFLGLLGEARAGTALTASGFVLAIPVFFDTVFYLLVPLARSMFRRTGRHYVKYVMAITAGGAVTHTLVPPTPGPLVIAEALQVDLGTMMVVGCLIGLPAAAAGLAFARWMDGRMPLVAPADPDRSEPPAPREADAPGLALSILPIALPVALITTHTVLSGFAARAPGSVSARAAEWTAVAGNASFALLVSAAVAVGILARQGQEERGSIGRHVEGALLSAGVIVLITAAGGAFGAMLREAGIGPAIQDFAGGRGGVSGTPLLFLAFLVASMLKFAQGSSTVAMITTAGMMGAMVDPAGLAFNSVYLAVAIGSGSLVGSWMNDSGFWIYSRMGGLSEMDTLRTWTPLLAVVGVSAMAVNVVMAALLPLAPGAQPPDVERLDPALDRLIEPGARVEVLAEGFDWSEGPVWVPEGGFLLFSDVPKNTIHRWKEGEGARPWLTPSGYTGSAPRGGETGSNGLAIDSSGRLLLCQHGDRRIARMDAPLSAPAPVFATIADRYEGARFNSPNDLVVHSSGDVYFTDPPYGLEKQAEDPAREIPFQGVYRARRNGGVELLARDMTRPNGLAFSPDETRLYVAQSDPAAAHWRVFDVNADGSLGASRVFFDATDRVKTHRGLPDGLKLDVEGNLFATGPGGVFVFSPDGRHLGTIRTGQATSNCAFGGDGHTLYITADMYLMRLRLKTKGAGFE